MAEKDDSIRNITPASHQDEDELKKDVQVKVIKGNEAFNEALIKDPPNPWSQAQLLIYLFSFVGFLCSTMNGYDTSLINNLSNDENFKAQFNIDNKGLEAGIVVSIYQVGSVVALPFVGPAVDTWGRRVGMLIGAGFVIIGTIVQGFSLSLPQFMGGRFLLGFGVSITSAAGPMYVIEINHPKYRGTVGALYNTLWLSGAIIASGAARGSLALEGNASWRLITWLQALCSGIIVLMCMLLPESPRWLFVNGKRDKARDMLTKYHANGNPDSPWVALQMHEYEEMLSTDGSDKRWWDYSTLYNSRAALYRMSCNLIVSIFGQWAGNTVLSYYLTAVLEGAGYTDPTERANIILINSCQQFAFAVFGALLVDKIGRRPLLIFSFVGCCVVWCGMTVANAEFDRLGGNSAAKYELAGVTGPASKACLAMIFLFGSVYSVGITPLQALYPVEVLSFEMRAKGMAFSSLAVAAASMMGQFAWPVSLKNIGWRTYIIFTVWDVIQAFIVWLAIPETKDRTLEELDEIFQAKNPVKASLQKKQITVDRCGDVVEVQNV